MLDNLNLICTLTPNTRHSALYRTSERTLAWGLPSAQVRVISVFRDCELSQRAQWESMCGVEFVGVSAHCIYLSISLCVYVGWDASVNVYIRCRTNKD